MGDKYDGPILGQRNFPSASAARYATAISSVSTASKYFYSLTHLVISPKTSNFVVS